MGENGNTPLTCSARQYPSASPPTSSNPPASNVVGPCPDGPEAEDLGTNGTGTDGTGTGARGCPCAGHATPTTHIGNAHHISWRRTLYSRHARCST